MMTRYDAWTNILRVTTAAFAAAIGGADDITTYPLTDALGLPTPFARRVARNTQHVLLEECRLGPCRRSGGRRLVRGEADARSGGQGLGDHAADRSDAAASSRRCVRACCRTMVAAARARTPAARSRRGARRSRASRDFPLLGAAMPEFVGARSPMRTPSNSRHACTRSAGPRRLKRCANALKRQAAPRVFFANMATLAEFGAARAMGAQSVCVRRRRQHWPGRSARDDGDADRRVPRSPRRASPSSPARTRATPSTRRMRRSV